MQPEESPALFFKYSPPQRSPGSGEDEEAKLPLLDFDLEVLPELGPKVDHFLQKSAGSSEEEDRNRSSPEPPVEEYERWVTWRAWVHDMPGWWEELAKFPKIDDHQELAQKVWASFKLPWQISEQHGVEITIRPHQHHCASTRRASSHSLTQSLPVWILGSCSWRRWLPMSNPSSFGWRKPICLPRANHGFWWGVYWS